MKLRERVIVLGAGVSGLTTAVRLLEQGFRVDVVADRHQPRTTGNLAGGLWYPYKVGGERVKRWALASLAVYRQLGETTRTGVRFVQCTCRYPASEAPPFWADAEVDYQESEPSDSEAESGVVRFRATLPVAMPSMFLPWLEARIAEKGGVMRLLDRPLGGLSGLPGTLIVNCTGLGARHLCHDDSVVPIRGVVVHMAGTGIDECLTDDTDPERPTYIIPNREFCVLGGSAQPNRWDVSVSESEVAGIVDRCAELDQRVRRGKVVGAFAGLRPGRHEVRLESEIREDDRVVVHNYGHGGSGFTLAWGCADEVADIVLAQTA